MVMTPFNEIPTLANAGDIIEKGEERIPTWEQYEAGDYVKKEVSRTLERCLHLAVEELNNVVNSAVHPEEAIRVVMVELKPIRETLTTIQTEMEKLTR